MYIKCLTPRRLHIIYPNKDPTCPRCRSLEADFLHMVWLCRVLRGFWTEVVEEVGRAATWPRPLEVKVILLGLILKTKGRKVSRKFVMLGIVLAKRRVAIGWLSRVPPRIEEWWKDILEWALAEEVHEKD